MRRVGAIRLLDILVESAEIRRKHSQRPARLKATLQKAVPEEFGAGSAQLVAGPDLKACQSWVVSLKLQDSRIERSFKLPASGTTIDNFGPI